MACQKINSNIYFTTMCPTLLLLFHFKYYNRDSSIWLERKTLMSSRTVEPMSSLMFLGLERNLQCFKLSFCKYIIFFLKLYMDLKEKEKLKFDSKSIPRRGSADVGEKKVQKATGYNTISDSEKIAYAKWLNK